MLGTDLVAEISLLGLAALVFSYRTLGGSNEWVRTHGIILVTYYAVGGLAYDELEGWPLLDTMYFLTVTITTVGYGDIAPETDAGKLFTVAYAVIGVIFVFAALSPLVDALMFVKELILTPIKPAEADEVRPRGTHPLREQNARTPALAAALAIGVRALSDDVTLCDDTRVLPCGRMRTGGGLEPSGAACAGQLGLQVRRRPRRPHPHLPRWPDHRVHCNGPQPRACCCRV